MVIAGLNGGIRAATYACKCGRTAHFAVMQRDEKSIRNAEA